MRRAVHPFLDHPGVLAFAHRGGAAEHPENTLAAFEACVRLGYRYVETDAWATRDGALLAFHDDRLDRVTDAHGCIADLTLSEVHRARLPNGERIPLLAELLAAWPHLRVNIDPKHDAAVEPLTRLLREPGTLDRVCVGSFSDARLRQLRRALGPRLCTSAGPLGTARLWASSRGAPLGAPRVDCLQVPPRWQGLTVVDRRFVRRAERAGLQVHVWTVDDPAAMHRLLDLGVRGLVTDRPSVLKDVLIARGQWA